MDAIANTSELASRKPTDSKRFGRSRVTNLREALPNVDGRTLIARRFRDVMTAIASDQGGLDELSEARLQLVRRFAACAVLAEEMEGRLGRGEAIDIAHHALLCSTLTRLASRIGLDRIPKDVLSLDTYLGQQGAAE